MSSIHALFFSFLIVGSRIAEHLESITNPLPTMEFKCKDVGFEECRWITTGNTEQEILQKCAVHAQKDHGMKPEEITEELRNKIRANIH